MMLSIFKIDWDKCKMMVRRDACYQYYNTWVFNEKKTISSLFTFKRVADSNRYDIKVYYIGDIMYDAQMNTIFDLFRFCNKVMYTKNRQRVKTPGLIAMFKLFK